MFRRATYAIIGFLRFMDNIYEQFDLPKPIRRVCNVLAVIVMFFAARFVLGVLLGILNVVLLYGFAFLFSAGDTLPGIVRSLLGGVFLIFLGIIAFLFLAASGGGGQQQQSKSSTDGVEITFGAYAAQKEEEEEQEWWDRQQKINDEEYRRTHRQHYEHF